MRATTLVAGTVAAALSASPAPAQTEVSEEGAAEIRQALADFLERARTEWGIQIELAGDIEVAPAGDLFEATIPEPTIRTEDGTIIGEPISMQIQPLENGWYDASWMLPERFTLTDAGQSGFITIGSQTSQGVFAPEFETFMALDVVLETVELIPPPDETGSLSVGRLAVQGDSQDLGEGRYSGDFAMELDEFDFVGVPGSEEMGIGALRFDWSVTDLDYPAYLEFQRALEELAAEPVEGQGPETVFDQASSLLAETGPLLDGLRARYRVDELAFTDGAQNVDIETGGFAVYLEGMRGDSSTFGLEMSSGAVGLVPAPQGAEFFPTDTRVQLSLVDLPNDQLLEVLSQFLTSAGQMGPDAAMMMAGLQLQQAVMAGGSTLQVQEVTVVNDYASLDLAGEVVPNQAAAFGVTATADMTITGLGDLIAALQESLGEDAQDAVSALTILQTMGAPVAEAEGDVRSYEFEVLETGQVLLNGADVAPLINAME
jgi:hypothetical protein